MGKEKTYTLQLTKKDMDIIFNALNISSDDCCDKEHRKQIEKVEGELFEQMALKKPKDRTFESYLKTQLKIAKKRYDNYKKRNKLDESGNPRNNYCDDDWSGLFESAEAVHVLKTVLHEWQSYQQRSVNQ